MHAKLYFLIAKRPNAILLEKLAPQFKKDYWQYAHVASVPTDWRVITMDWDFAKVSFERLRDIQPFVATEWVSGMASQSGPVAQRCQQSTRPHQQIRTPDG